VADSDAALWRRCLHDIIELASGRMKGCMFDFHIDTPIRIRESSYSIGFNAVVDTLVTFTMPPLIDDHWSFRQSRR